MTLRGCACLELWNAKQLCVSRTLMITWRSKDMHIWSCGMPNSFVFQELWWSHDAPRICTSGVVECQTALCFKNFDDHMTLQGYAHLELWNAKQLCVSRTLMITWRSKDMHIWSCGMPNSFVFQELWWSHDAPRICTSGVVECQTALCFKNCDNHMTHQGCACLELWNAKQLCVSRTLIITWRSEDMHVWSCGMPNSFVFQELWWSHDALRICMHIWRCGLLKGCVFQELWWPHDLLKRCLELGSAEGVYGVSPNLVIRQKNLIITCMYMHARWVTLGDSGLCCTCVHVCVCVCYVSWALINSLVYWFQWLHDTWERNVTRSV